VAPLRVGESPKGGLVVTYMIWKDQYSVENALIDKQHQTLFELVNEVAEKVKAKNMIEIKDVIKRLAAYTVTHFRDEEALLKKAGYANLEDHQMIHAELLRKVQDLQQKLAMNQAVSLVSVIRFLSDWLKDHILKDDMAYKASIKKLG